MPQEFKREEISTKVRRTYAHNWRRVQTILNSALESRMFAGVGAAVGAPLSTQVDIDIIKSPRPSPSVFAHCKWTKTGPTGGRCGYNKCTWNSTENTSNRILKSAYM